MNGRDDLLDTQKIEFDEYYLKNLSHRLDLKIIFITFMQMLGIVLNKKRCLDDIFFYLKSSGFSDCI